MIARIGRQRRMAGSLLTGGDGGAAAGAACPGAAGRRRVKYRGGDGGNGGSGVSSTAGSMWEGRYGRRSGTGSTVVSGGCRHPAGRSWRRLIGGSSLSGRSGGPVAAHGQHEQIARVLTAGGHLKPKMPQISSPVSSSHHL
jgi:hypothetical protein